MNILQQLIDGLFVSPYPLTYSLVYPWYAYKPSLHNGSGVIPAPSLKLPSDSLMTDSTDSSEFVRLVFFGDLLGLSQVPTFDRKLQQVFSTADLILGNLEGPLKPQKASNNAWSKAIDPNFLLGLLTAASISGDRLVLSVANNHSQDAGDEGLQNTLETLAGCGIDAVGQVIQGQPKSLIRYLRSDLTLSIWAWTHWLNTPSPQLRFSAPETFGVLRSEQVTNLLDTKTADTTLALPHWDYEYQHFPSSATRKLAKILADHQVDIVAGSHSHTLQPIEVFGNCHILYSLGNFTQSSNPLSNSLSSRLGALWEIMLHTNGPQRGRVAGYCLYPFLHDRQANHIQMVDGNHIDNVSPILDQICGKH